MPRDRFSPILLSRPAAAVALVALTIVTIGLVVVALGLPSVPDAGPAHGDLDTYAEVVQSLRAGQGYYAALHQALLAHGYATASVFNWRPPLFLSLVAWLPSDAWMQAGIAVVALVAAALATRLVFVERDTGPAIAVGALLVLSLAAVVAPRSGFMCELLAGALILGSVSSYGLARPWLGLATGAAALFTREIAGLYVVVCIFAAWREKRWRELGLWALVLAIYAAYYAWHSANVLAQLGPADRPDPVGWLRFGGAGFDIMTATFNGVFLLLPYWLTAALLPLAVLGLLAWRGPGGVRALWTVFGYLVLFAFLGKPNNSYWGALYTPLVALGLVRAPAALRDLLFVVARRVPGAA